MGANIIPNGERLYVLLLRPRARDHYLLCPLLFNIALEALVWAIREEKEIIGINLKRK